MKDIHAHLNQIRSDAAECLLVSTLVGDGKREVFAKTAQHLNALASEVEKAIATSSTVNGARDESDHVTRTGDTEGAIATDISATDPTDISATDHSHAGGSRRLLPWLLVVVIGGIVGIFFLVNNSAKTYWSLSSLWSKQELSPAPQDENKQAIAALLSDEQAGRKILMEELSKFGARLDNLAAALENLKTTQTEIVGPSSKGPRGAEEKSPATQATPAWEDTSVHRSESPASSSEHPITVKQPEGTPRANESRPIEPADRVGSIPAPARRAELDQRKPTIGPAGCTQFRSFDPVSGTYTTLDGRRRPCR